jgi:hypothetical protein
MSPLFWSKSKGLHRPVDNNCQINFVHTVLTIKRDKKIYKYLSWFKMNKVVFKPEIGHEIN